jgi:hypothetical protein
MFLELPPTTDQNMEDRITSGALCYRNIPLSCENSAIAFFTANQNNYKFAVHYFTLSTDIVTKCLKAGIEESFPRQRREAFPL